MEVHQYQDGYAARLEPVKQNSVPGALDVSRTQVHRSFDRLFAPGRKPKDGQATGYKVYLREPSDEFLEALADLLLAALDSEELVGGGTGTTVQPEGDQ